MRLFKRISSTVLASVDKVIADVENHDAVVESMLKELKTAAAECQVRLNRVAADGQKMQQELERLEAQEQQWTERATALAQESSEDSEQKALACLERRRQTRDQHALLTTRIKEHQRLQQQLQEQLKTINDRFAEINNKRHLLQSQQSVAEANRVVAAVTGMGSSSIDEALDRWQVSIVKMDGNAHGLQELNAGDVDELAVEFAAKESKQALLDELAVLRTAAKPNNE